MSERETDTRITTFLARLGALDAGERAKFKRDAGKTLAEASSMGLFYRVIQGLYGVNEEKYFLLATLYPLTKSVSRGNFGNSLRGVLNTNRKYEKGLNRRVEILLDAEEAQLPFRLRQAVKFLKSNDVPVNWEQLLYDLTQWNHPTRFVQKQWARAYFALPESSDPKTASASPKDANA